MKRLIKKSAQSGTPIGLEPSFLPMGEMDEADVKNNRCPACKNKSKPLEKVDGFKLCQVCGSAFKMFDGDAYTVVVK